MTPKQAIANELLILSGWSAGKVMWEAQGVARPSLPYISLGKKSLRDATILPEIRYSENPTGVPGNPSAEPPTIGTELLVTVTVQQTLVVQVSLFTSSTVGTSSAEELLDVILRKLHLPTSRARLEVSSVVFAYSSAIQIIPNLIEERFEGRAVADLTFRYLDTVSETETYIEQISGTVTLGDGPAQDFEIDSIY